MNTLCGELKFSNTINMTRNLGKDYAISWNSKTIFSELNDNDKVRIKTTKSKRGDILDRTGSRLATDSLSSNVGIVPGNLGDNKENSISQIAKLLEISTDYINGEIKCLICKTRYVYSFKDNSIWR